MRDQRKRYKYYGDLFIDCSGFAGFLVDKVFHEPIVSFADSLLTDRAFAINLPDDPEVNGIRPYTTASALKAGWMWEIPLFHRRGNGYVYSSQFTSDEEAERELREFFGKRAEKAELFDRLSLNREGIVAPGLIIASPLDCRVAF